jgi:integrase
VINHARREDPTLGANPVAVGLWRRFNRDRRRETHVNSEQMATFWAAAEGLQSKTISGFIRLALATGMRSGECRALRWDWVSPNWITVPAEYTKTGHTLRVPITKLVRSILAERRGLVAKGCPFVFPARVVGKFLQTPGRGFEEIARATGIRVTPHDLRRSFVTAARQAGVDSMHVKMLVNHKLTDITDTYNMPSDAQLTASAQRIADVIAANCGVTADKLDRLDLASGTG